MCVYDVYCTTKTKTPFPIQESQDLILANEKNDKTKSSSPFSAFVQHSYPGLLSAIEEVIADYELYVSLHRTCNNLASQECKELSAQRQRWRRKGIRVTSDCVDVVEGRPLHVHVVDGQLREVTTPSHGMRGGGSGT